MDNSKPKMVSMGKAFALYWKKYVDFKGKSTRSEFWWVQLWNFLIGLALIIVLALSVGTSLMSLLSDSDPKLSASGLGIIIIILLFTIIWAIATVIPSISIQVRRFRDAGMSFWWFVGAEVGIILVQIFLDRTELLGALLTLAIELFIFVIDLLPSKIVESDSMVGEGYNEETQEENAFGLTEDEMTSIGKITDKTGDAPEKPETYEDNVEKQHADEHNANGHKDRVINVGSKINENDKSQSEDDESYTE